MSSQSPFSVLNPVERLFKSADYGGLFNWSKDHPPEMEVAELQQIKYKFKSAATDKKLRANMRRLFSTFLIEDRDEGIPIACITFVLSLFISIDPDLKSKFLTTFQGYLRVITLFLLENLHIGRLSFHDYVLKFCLAVGYKEACYGIGLSETLYYYNFVKETNGGLSVVFTWFNYLSDSYENREQNYFSYVQYSLIRYQQKQNTLSCLSCENGKTYFYKGSSFESLSFSEKKVFHLLANAVQGQLVPLYIKEEQKQIVDDRKVPIEIIYENFDQKLIYLIISGKTE